MVKDLSGPRWVSTTEAVASVARRCRRVGRLALDTEADSLHSYYHKTCLIQVTVGGENFIIDPLVLKAEKLKPLWEILADPDIDVVMHGSDYDMRVLDRDFGAHIRGLRDTQEMAVLLGKAKTGLASLLREEFSVVLDKKYQRADWGRRPLPEDMIRYAASDTMYLEDLEELLRTRLVSAGRWEWALEEFRRLERIRHVEKEFDPLAFERIQGASRLKGRSRDRLHALYSWREKEAQLRDVPPFKILGNRALVLLADFEGEWVPENFGADRGLSPRLLRRWWKQLTAVLHNPPPAPERRKFQRDKGLRKDQRRLLNELSRRRNAHAAELGIPEGILCSKAILIGIVTADPVPVEEMGLEKAGLEGWRLRILGSDFLQVLRSGSESTV